MTIAVSIVLDPRVAAIIVTVALEVLLSWLLLVLGGSLASRARNRSEYNLAVAFCFVSWLLPLGPSIAIGTFIYDRLTA